MAIFAVVLHNPNDEVMQRVAQVYPDHYRLGVACAVVMSTSNLAETVATRVGIKGPDRIDEASGAVFRLQGAYSGYTNRDLWDWLGEQKGSF